MTPKEPFLISKQIEKLLQVNDLLHIQAQIARLIQRIQNIPVDQAGNLLLKDTSENIQLPIRKVYLERELQQIAEVHTLERAYYYLQRLLKSLSEVKSSPINDLNLNRWKEYDDLITDSLWIVDRRDSSGAHSADYWGNFIPQIPNQLIRRYTKKGEWVLDTFLGSGTTLIECQRLGRNGIGIDLQKQATQIAQNALRDDAQDFPEVQTNIFVGDSTRLNYQKLLKKIGIHSVQLVLIHPPYWDIIKFSEDEQDLSNVPTLDSFLSKMGQLIDAVQVVLEEKRYLALIISDKYFKGEWIPLGFYTMQEVLKRGFILKSTIVKNFEDTKGKMNQKELWRYRALAGGFYVFKHEYIFLFQKRGT